MLLTAALAYARHGIPVLPVHTPDPHRGCSCDRGVRCERPGKHPRLRHGLTDASTDPRQIELWWQRWPAANVGLRTGVTMDAADIDSAEGWHGLCHLLGGALPPGPRVRTGSGWHLWFHPTGFGNRVHLLPGLDWRGAGGYVVAPPSAHATGGDYRWVRRPGGPLPVAPPALLGLIEGPAAPEAHRPIAHPGRYALAALAAEADRVARAPMGSRNDTLNRAAFALGRLVGAGLLDIAGVTRELEAAAGFAGLGRAETRRTIRSGLTAGQRAPIAADRQGPNDSSQRLPIDRTHSLPTSRGRDLPTDSGQSLPTDRSHGPLTHRNQDLPTDSGQCLLIDRSQDGPPTGGNQGLSAEKSHGLPTDRDRGVPVKRVQHGRIDGDAGVPIDNDHGASIERDQHGPIESDPGRRVA